MKQTVIIGISLVLAAIGAVFLLEPVFKNGESPQQGKPPELVAFPRPSSIDGLETLSEKEKDNASKLPFDFSDLLYRIKNAEDPEEQKELLELTAANCEEATQVAELARLGVELLKPSDLADVAAELGKRSAKMESSAAAAAALETFPMGTARDRLLRNYFGNVSSYLGIRDAVSLMEGLDLEQELVALNFLDRKAIAGVFSTHELNELAARFEKDQNPAGEIFAQALAWKVTEGELSLSDLKSLPQELTEGAQRTALTTLLGKKSKPEITETLNDLDDMELSSQTISSLSDAVRHRLGSKEAFDVLQKLDSLEHAEIGIRNVVSTSFHVEPERTSKWIGELEPGYFRDVAISIMVKKMNPIREAAEIQAWTDAMQDKSLLNDSGS